MLGSMLGSMLGPWVPGPPQLTSKQQQTGQRLQRCKNVRPWLLTFRSSGFNALSKRQVVERTNWNEWVNGMNVTHNDR